MKLRSKVIFCMIVFILMFIGAWYINLDSRYVEQERGYQIQQLDGVRIKKERLAPRQYIKVIPKEQSEVNNKEESR
ncbi:hypothetical protein [Alkalihalobacillus pseudalcaliphilus]|uniref:hypothetical protein n=1 Tax=Alkalihalobacillus pseudalcaliphilus TaxID=79884 RepID=UPI00064E0E41|nr:hypothetical protein [Alkalihalobacillus pseudalcaliphilus]KMK75918.1 hypothetical protein AB990_11740 [Alkalihalobacillus pseudalcaliphilus]